MQGIRVIEVYREGGEALYIRHNRYKVGDTYHIIQEMNGDEVALVICTKSDAKKLIKNLQVIMEG